MRSPPRAGDPAVVASANPVAWLNFAPITTGILDPVSGPMTLEDRSSAVAAAG
jgi:hypothetical protein